jgi:hypothetical protein
VRARSGFVATEKQGALHRRLQALVERRKASGGTRLDRLPLSIIRTQLLFGETAGPPVDKAQVYRDRGGFLVVVHYAYRDDAGREHPATGGSLNQWLDARKLGQESWGLGDVPNLRSLGRPVTLDF